MVGKGLSICLSDCHLLCLRVKRQKAESVNDFFNSFVRKLSDYWSTECILRI